MNFYKKAKEIEEELIEYRRYFHKNAEIGMDLPKTVEYVEDRLKAMGIEPRRVGKSGITALIGDETKGKTILLRGDMDALPMDENNDLDFKSVTGNSHNCGHDMHTAILLGGAQLLKDIEDELDGAVKLMFQPGEETFEGAQDMVDEGILEDPKVDGAAALHMSVEEEVGHLYYGEGYVMSSCDGFKITVQGKGCHGAMPNLGVDPINVGVHIYLALQELVAREISPSETVVLTVGEFSAGSANNIIPDTAVLKGTLRTYNPEVREFLNKRIREVVDLTAETYRATAKYESLSEVPPLLSNPDMMEEVIGSLDDLDYDIKMHPGYTVSASDDFAIITEEVPSVYLNVGAKVKDNPHPLHNPGVLFDEDILALGAAIQGHTAYNWLKNNK